MQQPQKTTDDLLADILEAIGKLSTVMQKPMPPTGSPGSGGIGDAARRLSDAARALGNFARFNQTNSAVSQAVQLARPGDVAMLSLTMKDLGATIGMVLAPVLRLVTRIIRSFADVILNLSPQTKQLIGAMAGAAIGTTTLVATLTAFKLVITALSSSLLGFLATGAVLAIGAAITYMATSMDTGGRLAAAFGGILDKLASIFDKGMSLVAAALEGLVPVFEFFLTAVEAFVDGLLYLVNSLLWALDMAEIQVGGKQKKSSVGIAAIPFSSGTSDELYRKNAQASFQLGAAASPETLELQKLNQKVDALAGAFIGYKAAMKQEQWKSQNTTAQAQLGGMK